MSMTVINTDAGFDGSIEIARLFDAARRLELISPIYILSFCNRHFHDANAHQR